MLWKHFKYLRHNIKTLACDQIPSANSTQTDVCTSVQASASKSDH